MSRRSGPASAEALPAFPVGSTVVLRELVEGRVRSARPLRVVDDDPRRFAGYLVPRSAVAWPRLADGRQSQTPDQGWALVPERWQGPGALFVVPTGSAYAAVLFFDPATGAPTAWKVDFLLPLRRTAVGFDTLDLALDLLVDVDLGAWRAKDLDDLAQLRRLGALAPTELEAVAATRGHVEALLRAGGGPFGEGWDRWRPDATWPPLGLPPGWSDVPAGSHPLAGLPGGGLRSASGIRGVDAGGATVVDLDLAGGTLVHGHAHPGIVEALTRQAALGWAFEDDHPAVAALRARLEALAPAGWSVTWWPDAATAMAAARDAMERAAARSPGRTNDAAPSMAAGIHAGSAGPVDLRRDLARGLRAGRPAGPLVFGPSLFAGLGGAAVVAPPEGAPPAGAQRPSALHAVGALETLHLLDPLTVSATAARAEQVRRASGIGGDGPFLVLPVEARDAARRAGLLVGRDGRGLLATVADDADVDDIVDRLGDAVPRPR